MAKAVDATGLKFGRLTAVSKVGRSSDYGIVWLWKCDCGKEIERAYTRVRSGYALSCGCFRGQNPIRKRDASVLPDVLFKRKSTQAQKQKAYYDAHPEKALLISCKTRAKKAGLPFNLTSKDIVIPPTCPVLNIEIRRGRFEDRDTSPSIDKIIPELGYVTGNIAVISFRANRFKNDATVAELEKIVAWMKSHTAA